MAQPAPSPVPAGMHTLTTHLWFAGNCAEAIERYAEAFGAEVVGEVAKGPDGKSVMHALVRIGDSNVMLADAWPGMCEQAPTDVSTAGLFMYVEDCDAAFDRAIAAGCEPLFPVADMFWGDRMGKLKDPFGHCWAIATHKTLYTPKEVEAGQKAWLASMADGPRD